MKRRKTNDTRKLAAIKHSNSKSELRKLLSILHCDQIELHVNDIEMAMFHPYFSPRPVSQSDPEKEKTVQRKNDALILQIKILLTPKRTKNLTRSV